MTTALARRLKVDVSTDGTTWIPLRGINDLNPGNPTPTNQDATDYDTTGWAGFEKTLEAWTLTAKCNRKTTSGVFDPGQELARLANDQFGDQARLYVRWYDRNGAPEAYTGLAIITWAQSKTGVVDLDEVTITFTGDGARTAITNPYVPVAVPTIVSVTPSGAGAAAQVQIKGSGFTGTVPTTGVKFGATNATVWTVNSDSLITATLPTGSAGSAPVVVTNATGASAAFAYTRTT